MHFALALCLGVFQAGAQSTMFDAFISYSRTDYACVAELVRELEGVGKSVWWDADNIHPAEEWRPAIRDGIESSVAFVYVVSPNSIVSGECARELEHAVRLRMRIIPLVVAATDPATAHEELRKRQWLRFDEPEARSQRVADLVRVLDGDLEWDRYYARLKQRATDWDNKGRGEPGLLRRENLQEAVEWLSNATQQGKTPSEIVIEFLKKSQLAEAAEVRRYRKLYNQAERQRKIALARQLASQSQLVLASRPDALPRALLLSTESMRRLLATRAPTLEADHAMRVCLALAARAGPRLDHGGEISASCWSSDGSRLATGSRDGVVALWNAHDGEAVWRATTGTPVASLAFSPSGKYLAVETSGADLDLLDAASGTLRNRLPHSGTVTSFTFHPQHDVIAAASGNHAFVWSGDDFTRCAELEHAGPVAFLAFHPDPNLLATLANVGHGRIWNCSQGPILDFDHGMNLTQIGFSPDGSYMGLASKPMGAVYFLSKTDKGWEMIRVFGASNSESATSFAFNPRYPLAAMTSLKTTLRVFDLERRIVALDIPQYGRVDAVSFGASGQYMYSRSSDQTIRSWELFDRSEAASGEPVLVVNEKARVVLDKSTHLGGASPQGHPAVLTGYGASAQVWDMSELSCAMELEARSTIVVLAFSESDRWVAGGTLDSRVIVWDTATRKETFRSLPLFEPTFGVAFESLQLTPDGRFALYSLLGGRMVALLDAAVGRISRLMPDDFGGRIVAVSLRWQFLATICQDRGLEVWRLARNEGEPLHVVGPAYAVSECATKPDEVARGLFSLDETAIGLADTKGTVSWYALPTGELVSMAVLGSAKLLTLSSDRRFAAVCVEERIVEVQSCNDGSLVGAPLRHEKAVRHAAFSPDGLYLATTMVHDGTLSVWNTGTGELVAAPALPGADLVRCTFSANGRYVTALPRGKPARVWLWRPKDLLAEAHSRLSRNLTRDEWEKHLPGERYRKTCPAG